MPKLLPVEPDFVDAAPTRLVFEAVVRAPREQIFAAVSDDPATWKEWFPGFGAGGYGPKPWGLGTPRWVKIGGTRYDESMIEWDEPAVWTYRVDRTTLPMAKALVERWTFDPDGDGTLVRWIFAFDPRIGFRLGGPLMPMLMRRLFTRAMQNLETRLRGGT